jgi:hypothetical protein
MNNNTKIRQSNDYHDLIIDEKLKDEKDGHEFIVQFANECSEGSQDFSDDENNKNNNNDPSKTNKKNENTSKGHLLRTISQKLRKHVKEISDKFYSRRKFEYTILLCLVLLLTLTQIVFIHDFNSSYSKSIKKMKNESAVIKYVCSKVESNYMTEELIIIPFAVLFFTILWAKQKTRRFNKYIMVKFKSYFNSKFFKDIQKQKKYERQERIKVTFKLNIDSKIV